MSEKHLFDNDSSILLDDEEQDIRPPRQYAVIFLNDDFTPVDFVAGLLMKLFMKGIDEAQRITMEIHEKGKGIAGVFSRDIAETKSIIANNTAQANGHPLKTIIEPIEIE
jgi:ATP-dependent Clp protease adaptor protein ClpS